ncbi:leucine-rich repeat domain-containing protein [Chitinophaga pinensis]|uniref:Leucine-rich repeat protein n=1 Tax=Chitinophaga pinensis (strain ATCC 43595 / DSM 2588 / LMG 13176 / NBRC 15968 / NCIMB 11800 / UQM 2034) TaxID=485918 RepID=A0A979G901_CHIPD|nr:leucine-rich repeat domain-containing protein [Chitinophaga pinensis]ACU63129.1 leucine-rich repeat protein [Chitinophaga pinensis DSM 2588]
MTSSPLPKLISNDEALLRFHLEQFENFSETAFQNVLLLDGDTTIDGDLDQQWTENTLASLGVAGGVEDTLILVNGNLQVAGTIKPSEDTYPFLLVLGNVQCEVIKSYDEFIYITGDADIKYALDGNYNHGDITIDGITRVPYILISDHSTSVKPEGAILINYFSDRDDFFAYDFTVEDFERVMAPETFNEKGNFSHYAFIEVLKTGKSPLKEGARPAKLILLDELEQLGKENSIETLDLSDKKLKVFPLAVTKITSLKKLILSDNPIKNIPASIKDLVNLEELHVERCSLENLPDEVFTLSQLRVLNVARNHSLQLPETINALTSLRTLSVSYNTGFGLPANVAGLNKLEELTCYQCTTSAPIDFPEVLTQLTGLKRLLMGSNSIKTIPESFFKLQQLEELDLDASLCYLNEIPDLSRLKNLKTLHANGLISYTTRPSPKQHLLKSFFAITTLEALYIDRHGERKEAFIKQDAFKEIEENLSHDPERFQEFADKLTIVPNMVWGDGRKGIVREALTVEHLAGISNLQQLKMLDLSFNGLTSVPDELFTLKHLQYLDLRYNRLSTSQRLKIARNLPDCTIDFRDNRVEDEQTNNEDVLQWQAMNALMHKANVLMGTKNDREKLLESLHVYDEVLSYFSSGKVVDEYNLLYANYGKVYAYSYLTSTHKASFPANELQQLMKDSIEHGLHTLSLVPAMIWHFTNLGAFHEEVTRITANSVAWNLHVLADSEEELTKALRIIEKAIPYSDSEPYYFIYDTQVRILLKLGNKEEAYQTVKGILRKSPDFVDFQDFKTNADYLAWLEK